MPYCVAVGCQNASGGIYAVTGLSWHIFPVNDKPLLDKWLYTTWAEKRLPPPKNFTINVEHN